MADAVHTPGMPMWVDVSSDDLPASRAFYEKLFDWTSFVAGEDFGGYTIFSKNGKATAGLGPRMNPAVPPAWTVYFWSENPEGTSQVVASEQGSVLSPTMTVPGMGSFAVFQATDGSVFGTWTPGGMSGYELSDEAGAVIWLELATLDYQAAVPFYSDVLGWSTSVMSDDAQFRYTVFGNSGVQPVSALTNEGASTPEGGVWDAKGSLPDGIPSHWGVYIGTDDIEASVTKATELGGKILRDIWPTPFGRMAQIQDPAGAIFYLGEIPQG